MHRKICPSTMACERQMAFGAPVVPELARIRPMVFSVSSITGGLSRVRIEYSKQIFTCHCVFIFLTNRNSQSASSLDSIFSMHRNPFWFSSIVMISASNSAFVKCDCMASAVSAWQITNCGNIFFNIPFSFNLQVSNR